MAELLVESFVFSLYYKALCHFKVNGETEQNAYKCILLLSIETVNHVIIFWLMQVYGNPSHTLGCVTNVDFLEICAKIQEIIRIDLKQ